MALRDFTVPCSLPVTGGKIAFVAEAPARTEMDEGEVLVGPSGQEFSRMLSTAGIVRSECLLTNVFDFRLPGDSVGMICVKKSALPRGETYPHPAISPGNYLLPDYFDCLDRLRTELELAKPNVVVPLGNTALWAVCGTTGIGKMRGSVCESSLIPGLKALPTYHPAAILRAWDNRSVVIADLMKARAQAEYPEIRRPHREIWTCPDIGDLYDFANEHIPHVDTLLSVDIETAKGFMTCIGFSPDPQHALVVPFVDRRNKENYSYWPDVATELQAYEFVRHLLEGSNPKLFQYGLYDIQWLFRKMNMRVRNCQHDTMFLHHALQPEMEKGLGFLGSLYTDEVSWKILRPRGDKEEKKDA